MSHYLSYINLQPRYVTAAKSRQLMSVLCTCPAASEIPDIPILDCIENMGQVWKAVFQRKFSTGSTRNGFTITSVNPNLLASWTTVLAASDGTKVVQTPFFDNPVSEPGAARTYGGGNETRGGIARIVGKEPQGFAVEFLDTSQQSIVAIKDMQCQGEMGVYLINEFGKIIGITDDLATPTVFRPIPIAIGTLFVSDKGFGGLVAPDKNMVNWQFLPNWSDYLHIVTPSNFDALTQLVTP